MGLWSIFLTNLGFLRRKVCVLIIGLDNSGKTTLVANFLHPTTQPPPPPGGILHSDSNSNAAQPSPPPLLPPIVPTVGFSLDRFNYQNLHITVFDMSGQGRYRPFWEKYYGDADGVVWVIDSSDTARISVAREELWRALGHPEIKHRTNNINNNNNSRLRLAPLLVFANKADVSGGMTAEECAAALGLDAIRDRNWNIV
ncbi:ADP-ribosylation factor-like protein 6 [Geranomyces michiganensis]|nr:ADP-ribosylation factor-like protein 6 [Geranomyces michiganensis]